MKPMHRRRANTLMTCSGLRTVAKHEMLVRILTFASLALILGVGNAVAACDFALRSTKVTDAQIKRAIEIVNAAVRDPELVLFFSNTTEDNASSDEIPVHHIRPDQARPVVAEVPAGCRTIVISGVHFERNFAVLSKDNVLMQDKQISMLVFLLLHELGHIGNRHYGAFLPATADAVPNNDETEAKARERQADDYVATILKREFSRLGNGNPPIDNYDLYFGTTEAIMFLSSLSFVVSSEATLACFGCRSLGDPRIFWDHGQSHPNFEYRLLLINHAISATPESQALLDSYEKMRNELSAR
ncbi:hypothetical protein [Mesorhizobium sp. M0910]|uniref:hypothetical protein n=1 Tax=Mesorhizobium sp. M0910 TaxID=2957025 RepID=UPI003339E220